MASITAGVWKTSGSTSRAAIAPVATSGRGRTQQMLSTDKLQMKSASRGSSAAKSSPHEEGLQEQADWTTPRLARLRAAHSVLLVSVGAAVADAENFNMLNPGGGPELEDVALMRLHQCSRYRRYPTHFATTAIGLVN